ncbi:hypothetical protein PLICRDRAFT_167568 [Plicaturopsis crispa FD-325 SS-3]|uniref:Unplaced genomic scaffold PLICRscaffold_17, whole genome shotgun sequence n=1 Tax=Plicaturopsis crispa FD-325 SS-3 TaxID=944288 RepID=A0A0C9SRE5_PLICR|nr:hypothetical protein PLICRDRAFT_167568 [Plicaturopsis crispa FD-325 SS-3]
MIVVPEAEHAHKSSKAASETEGPITTPRPDANTEDAPPSYTLTVSSITDSQAAGGPSAPSTLESLPPPTQGPPPDVRPTNYLLLDRANAAIKGTYVVDPSMAVHASFLAPLGKGEAEGDRKNLQLISKNGRIAVNIWLVGSRGVVGPDGDLKTGARATLDLKSYNGPVNVKTHVGEPEAPIPFLLTVTSYNGAVQLYLPRSFTGPLTITSNNGSVTYSDQVKEHLTTFSEVNRRHLSFVGDSSEWTGQVDWAGDAATVESKNGKVQVRFVDEARAEQPAKPGFFSKWLSS